MKPIKDFKTFMKDSLSEAYAFHSPEFEKINKELLKNSKPRQEVPKLLDTPEEQERYAEWLKVKHKPGKALQGLIDYYESIMSM